MQTEDNPSHHETSARPRDSLAEVGAPMDWAIDLAIVGVVTTLSLGLVSYLPASTLLVAACFAALGGAALGAIVPRLFHRHVRRIPVLVLLAAGVGLGACWGIFAGVVAGLLTGSSAIAAAELVGTASALQLGWLWLPTLLGRANGRSAWPIVAAACLLSPAIGWLAVQHVMW